MQACVREDLADAISDQVYGEVAEALGVDPQDIVIYVTKASITARGSSERFTIYVRVADRGTGATLATGVVTLSFDYAGRPCGGGGEVADVSWSVSLQAARA